MVRLARPRSGHFDLGTGYHGDLWLDLDALLLRPSLRARVRWLAVRLREHSQLCCQRRTMVRRTPLLNIAAMRWLPLV